MADNSHQSAAVAAAEAEAAEAVAQSAGVQQQPDELQMFWTSQREEIQQINDLKNHKLPISRIKKIMKSDRDVHMITGESPVLVAKACELFIVELTLRAWLQAQEYRRRTVRNSDFADAIGQTEIFDFLVDVVSRVGTEQEATGFWLGMVGSPGSGVPYCYPPMGPPAPPMEPPAPQMGQPAPPVGQPAPPMGQPAAPMGRPAPPMGQPAPPMGPRAPPMGRPAPSRVKIQRRAMPWVAPSVHFRPPLQVWESLMQAAEDDPSATGGNSGQGKL